MWDVDEAWRVGLYVNTDEDNTTGYNGGFLAVGADVLVEAAGSYAFTGASQAEWGWNPTADLARDQTVMTDVELAIPRNAIGNPSLIDFVLFANNYCCDFQLPDDIYPNGGGNPAGEFFTYELSAVPLAGDFDSNGVRNVVDIDLLTAASASGKNEPKFDLNKDTLVDTTDVNVWAKELAKTWIGDANVDGEFNSADFVDVFQKGKYEQPGALAVWSEGDWNGDGGFTSGDFVAAFQDGGYELGAGAAVSAVPEPDSALLLVICVMGLLAQRTKSRRYAPPRPSRCRSSQKQMAV